MTYWLLVERFENWEVDRKEGFRRFGLPGNKKQLASQMKRGDKLIFYVSSGLSKFADIREVSEEGTFDLGVRGGYDTAFPISISTRPVLTLDLVQWVPIHDLIPKLSITATHKDWRQVMRTSLRRISDEDAVVIIDTMNQATLVR